MAVGAPPQEQAGIEDQAAHDVTQAIVDHLDRGVARVLIGDGLEEWEFPVRLLPENVTDGTVLLLEARGGDKDFEEEEPIGDGDFVREGLGE